MGQGQGRPSAALYGRITEPKTGKPTLRLLGTLVGDEAPLSNGFE